jgi:hypothetical protein
MGAGGAGAFVGGALAATGRRRRSLRDAIGMYALAALLPIALGLSAPLVVLAACAFAGGAAGGFFSATWFTVFQQNVPDNVMSRTSAWDWLLSLSTLPLLMILVPLSPSGSGTRQRCFRPGSRPSSGRSLRRRPGASLPSS